MNAVVLAGGVRSGLEIPGSNLPRALWPLPAEPIISHVLSFLVRQGCAGMAICANGKTRMMAEQLTTGAQPWTGLHFSEDILPRGSAGCLRDLQEWAGKETILAIQGTGWYDFDLAEMLADHRQNGAAVTVGANASGDGCGLEPAGVYLIEPRTLDLISPVGFQDLKEQFIPKIIAGGMRVHCHRVQGEARLIHSVEHYLTVMDEAIERAALPVGMKRRGDVVIHESAVVHENIRLSGPAWIDAGVVVEEGSVLLGPVMLGSGTHVGAGAMIRRAVVMRGAKIKAGAMVNSSVIGPDEVRNPTILRGMGGRNIRERGWGRRPAGRMLSAKA